MSYKTFASMNIAIAGSGDLAEAYAISYVAAGHVVYLAGKNGSKPSKTGVAAKLDSIIACSIEEAAREADLIIICAPPKDVREIAYWLGDVRGKLIIDASANLELTIDEQLNTANAIKAITGSSYIIKVFCTRSYRKMLKPCFNSEDVKWIMVGDSKKAKEAVKILAHDLGVSSFIDLGSAENIPLLDELAYGWKAKAAREYATVQESR